MRKVKITLLLVVLLALVIACSGFDKNTYKALNSARITYTQTMSALSDYQKQGKLTNEQAKKILEVANIYYMTYLTAEAGYQIYHKDPNPTSEQAMTQLLNQVAIELARLLAVYNQVFPPAPAPIKPSTAIK